MKYYHYIVDPIRYQMKFAAECEGMSPPVKEAVFFRKLLTVFPLHIKDDDIFACWYGFDSADERDSLQVPLPPPPTPASSPAAPPKLRPIDYLVMQGFFPGGYDRGHYIIDLKTIMARGVKSYIEEVRAELENPQNSEEKNQYLQGMLESLEATEIFTTRFAELAEEQAKTADDENAQRLLRIANACRKVPMLPPEDFFEAMQAVAFLRILHCISSYNSVSVSLGSIDQYLYPYYVVSKEKGMTDDEAVAMILQLFRMLSLYDGGDCAVSVGGVDENGNDATNPLSYLMVKAEKISHLSAPIFAARINKQTPKEFMRELVSKELFEMGQPTFYSEENCRDAAHYRGVDMETAKKFEISTCMNIAIAGKEVTNAWGCVANSHLPLELALNNGKPLSGEMAIDFKTKPRSDYQNIDELFAQYKSYFAELFDIATDFSKEIVEYGAKAYPIPLVSAFTDDCIKRGKDRWDGGAVYHNMVTEMMGFANTADAFTAIETLVFEQKKYTLDDFVKAAKANYVGYEALHRDIANCENYGMNAEKADYFAKRLLDTNADVCEAKSKGYRKYLPSLHTLWTDISWGHDRPAFFDGRLQGEPVNKNAGPTQAALSAGPTNVVLSAGKIDQLRYNGGQALDVHIGASNLDTPAKSDKISAFIRTYFELGGLQLQVNGLSADTLQKAYDEPDKYKNLLIRIGGHSRYFRELPNQLKLFFIERFKIEEGSFSK